METQETLVLQKAIEKWINKNIDKVLKAQEFSKKILESGLLDPDKTLPFQILPTNFFDSDGDLVCKIFVNLDSPIYGYFSIELEEESCAVTCPNSYKTEYFIQSYEDCDKWLDEMNSSMDIFYQLSSAAEEGQKVFCNMILNDLLKQYKVNTKNDLDTIKSVIDENPRVAIVTGEMFALAKDAKKDFSRALLIPQAWAVFADLDDLPDQGESAEGYICEFETNELFDQLNVFFRKENFAAAGVYLAQRICLQAGMDVQGFSSTEDGWVVASLTDGAGELVLPCIDITEFKVV